MTPAATFRVGAALFAYFERVFIGFVAATTAASAARPVGGGGRRRRRGRRCCHWSICLLMIVDSSLEIKALRIYGVYFKGLGSKAWYDAVLVFDGSTISSLHNFLFTNLQYSLILIFRYSQFSFFFYFFIFSNDIHNLIITTTKFSSYINSMFFHFFLGKLFFICLEHD